MRLINTKTLELREFVSDEELPRYAILSHTWGDEEVTFQELSKLKSSSGTECRAKSGFLKIEQTCRLARDRDIKYAWVDTCCIDKTSSAELTEAINSMFRWYEKAFTCFIYLSDLEKHTSISIYGRFRACRWFSRGWTLQELIAPKTALFYDKKWTLRGTKEELSSILHTITGIDEGILRGAASLGHVPVARRMSWASGRQTTRVEDTAYALLGIFDVNMPLVYGEGEKAFQRLQEEIIKERNDLSIFAWTASSPTQQYRGILATSPQEFRGCRNLHGIADMAVKNEEFSMGNKGLKIQTKLIGEANGDYFLPLNCYLAKGFAVPISIGLGKVEKDVFVRSCPAKLMERTTAQDASRLLFEETRAIHILKRVGPTLYNTLMPACPPPFIFGSWFAGQRGYIQCPGSLLQMQVTPPALNHAYNDQRTLRTKTPPAAFLACPISLIETTAEAVGETTIVFSLWIWIGTNKDGEPWIHCMFEGIEGDVPPNLMDIARSSARLNGKCLATTNAFDTTPGPQKLTIGIEVSLGVRNDYSVYYVHISQVGLSFTYPDLDI
jgi:hypothetical protein